jgi:hypothetical protein
LPSGTKYWYKKGKKYTFQEWLQLIPNPFIVLWKYYDKPYHPS